MTISIAIRQRVRQRANFQCEYCHSSEEASASLFTLDHIVPQSFGGDDSEANLALACHRCNGRRYNFTEGTDSQTNKLVPLFNPRKDRWFEHFSWSTDGYNIFGITPIGRATIDRLDLNDDFHDDGSIQRARRLWIRGGWHPPTDDPRSNSR
jgi:5-methylcytosine-specific restriction endonuclease McrA